MKTITVAEASKILDITKEEVKQLVDSGVFIKIADNGYRYLLDYEEVFRYRNR